MVNNYTQQFPLIFSLSIPCSCFSGIFSSFPLPSLFLSFCPDTQQNNNWSHSSVQFEDSELMEILQNVIKHFIIYKRHTNVQAHTNTHRHNFNFDDENNNNKRVNNWFLIEFCYHCVSTCYSFCNVFHNSPSVSLWRSMKNKKTDDKLHSDSHLSVNYRTVSS